MTMRSPRSPDTQHCPPWLRLGFALLLGVASSSLPHAAAATHTVDAWLAHQTNVMTWTAKVTQTRTLKSLVQPLTATGRIWFAAPHHFRWELGDPPQTIAVRQPQQMLVIYPLLKRVEQYPLNSARPGPWRDALALLEAGFPRSRAELESRFNLLDSSPTNGLQTVSLQPRSASARRLMPLIRVGFDRATYALRFTHIQFADGSSMRNEFDDARVNPILPEDAFTPHFEPDWEVVPSKTK
jgi:outer membrane lipoprotein-sorting protein